VVYGPIMKTLGQGYSDVIREQTYRAFTPFIPSTVSAGRFAEIIDTNFLGEGKPGPAFTFADLNPARPHLYLNATIVSQNRIGLHDQVASNGCRGLGDLHFLRRRPPDEFFHFAFSDLYFSLLHSRLDSYPLAAGVASSSAFPALIDCAELRDHCKTQDGDPVVKLIDGGANDNQALIEIYMVLAELVYQQHRSDLWATRPDALERLTSRDRAFVVVVNPSVAETTGTAGKVDRPFGVVGLLDAVIAKTLAAIDVYSAEGYTLRKQSYLTLADLLRRTHPDAARVYPSEIAITSLDQYALGGTEAALRIKAHIADPLGADIAAEYAALRAARQQRAYDAIVEKPEIRRLLRLPDYHPQCYYDMRKALDALLIKVDAPNQACSRKVPAGRPRSARKRCATGTTRS
jgi:hypothetical protein